MPFLWKRTYKSGKTVWVIYYRVGKKQKSKVIGETDKRTAEKAFRKFCSELADKKFGLKELEQKTLAGFIEEYLEFARNEKAVRTVEREEQILKPFLKYFDDGNIYLHEFQIRDLRTYRTVRLDAISEETMNLEFRHLKAIFNTAKSFRYILENPFATIKPIRLPQSDLPKFFELEDIQRIREGLIGDEFETLIDFYFLTGARLREPLSLTWDDVDFKRKFLVIRSVHAKSKKHRIISFEDDQRLSDLLSNLLRREDNLLFGPSNGSTQWTYWWVSRRTSLKFTELGFPWATIHTCRHTYISHLIMAGVPLTTVQYLVGHSSISTTLKYAHLAPKHKQDMAGKRPY